MGFENIHHHFKFSFNKELSEIYVSVMLRGLALSMIAIFIPIYLYNDLGYSLEKIVFFLTLLFGIFAISTPTAAHMAAKIGFKHNILFSSFLYILSFLMLNFLETHWIFFILAPTCFGLANSLYWLSFHTDMAKSTIKRYRGRQMAVWQVLASIAAIAGPFSAGLILTYFSFTVLFVVGSSILVLSAVPLFFSRDQHIKSNFSYKVIFKRDHLKDVLLFVSSGTKYAVYTWLWPFFIFLFIAEYLKFGSTIAVLGVITMLSYGIVGGLSDKVRAGKLMRFGAVIHFVSTLFMGLVRSIIHIFAVSAGATFSLILIDTPLTRKSYEKGKRRNIIEYLAFREIMLNTGRVILFLLFLGILYSKILEHYEFITIFILAGITSVVHFFHYRKYR